MKEVNLDQVDKVIKELDEENEKRWKNHKPSKYDHPSNDNVCD